MVNDTRSNTATGPTSRTARSRIDAEEGRAKIREILAWCESSLSRKEAETAFVSKRTRRIYDKFMTECRNALEYPCEPDEDWSGVVGWARWERSNVEYSMERETQYAPAMARMRKLVVASLVLRFGSYSDLLRVPVEKMLNPGCVEAVPMRDLFDYPTVGALPTPIIDTSPWSGGVLSNAIPPLPPPPDGINRLSWNMLLTKPWVRIQREIATNDDHLRRLLIPLAQFLDTNYERLVRTINTYVRQLPEGSQTVAALVWQGDGSFVAQRMNDDLRELMIMKRHQWPGWACDPDFVMVTIRIILKVGKRAFTNFQWDAKRGVLINGVPVDSRRPGQ